MKIVQFLLLSIAILSVACSNAPLTTRQLGLEDKIKTINHEESIECFTYEVCAEGQGETLLLASKNGRDNLKAKMQVSLVPFFYEYKIDSETVKEQLRRRVDSMSDEIFSESTVSHVTYDERGLRLLARVNKNQLAVTLKRKVEEIDRGIKELSLNISVAQYREMILRFGEREYYKTLYFLITQIEIQSSLTSDFVQSIRLKLLPEMIICLTLKSGETSIDFSRLNLFEILTQSFIAQGYLIAGEGNLLQCGIAIDARFDIQEREVEGQTEKKYQYVLNLRLLHNVNKGEANMIISDAVVVKKNMDIIAYMRPLLLRQLQLKIEQLDLNR